MEMEFRRHTELSTTLGFMAKKVGLYDMKIFFYIGYSEVVTCDGQGSEKNTIESDGASTEGVKFLELISWGLVWLRICGFPRVV